MSTQLQRYSFPWRAAFYPILLTLFTAGLSWLSTWISGYIRDDLIWEKSVFTGFMLLFFGIYTAAVWEAVRGRIQMHTGWIVGWALLMRLLLLPGSPVLETDQCRYLWDGLVLSHGFNPYKYAPAEISAFAEDERLFPPRLHDELRALNQLRTSSPQIEQNFALINNNQVPTPYLPAAQVAFALASLLSPGSLWGWRIIVLLADILILRLLIGLLRRLDLPESHLLIYAWSPLVLKEYINTTHYDLIMMALVLLAFRFLLPGGISSYLGNKSKTIDEKSSDPLNPKGPASPALAGVALGAAVLTKLMPIALVAIWCRRLGLRGLATFVITIPVLTLPFIGFQTQSWKNDPAGIDNRQPGFYVGQQAATGLVTFGHHWEFNSSLTVLLEHGFEKAGFPAYGEPKAKILFQLAGWTFRLDAFLLAKATACGIAAIVCIGIALYLNGFRLHANQKKVWHDLRDGWAFDPHRHLAAALFIVGVLLLCSPVCNPWYVGWLVPLLVFVPRAPWLLLTGTTFLYYLYFVNNGYLPGIRWFEYGPVYLWLLIEAIRNWKPAQNEKSLRIE